MSGHDHASCAGGDRCPTVVPGTAEALLPVNRPVAGSECDGECLVIRAIRTGITIAGDVDVICINGQTIGAIDEARLRAKCPQLGAC